MVLSKRARMVHSRTLGCECLVHDARWRSSYQHVLNATRGTVIPAKYIPRVNKIVCNCNGGRLDEEFISLYEKELKCSKENIKELKAYFAKTSLAKAFKDTDNFVREILLGAFTVDHTSKYHFLVIMKNVVEHDFTLLGGENEDDWDAYPVERKFHFTLQENFVKELTEDKAKKLNEVIAVAEDEDEDGENMRKVSIQTVRKQRKNKEMKVINGTVHSKTDESAEQAWDKLDQWLQKNFEVKLQGEKLKRSREYVPPQTNKGGKRILIALSIIVVIFGIGLYYYFQ